MYTTLYNQQYMIWVCLKMEHTTPNGIFVRMEMMNQWMPGWPILSDTNKGLGGAYETQHHHRTT
jgi:hypothetical protein